ncbi:hypothetical protein [Rhodohalobacter halophilus]|uniref:hypothetical protein n=1 Tax=Rhodohalobacter halophilus TaxID=1812810 RepID=UPI00083F9A78|nr:hypothetical protein [Rhodohalobacter halophilus]
MNKENRKKNLIITGIILPLIVGIFVEVFTTVEVVNYLFCTLIYIGGLFIASFSISVWLFILIVILSIGLGAGVVLLNVRTTQENSYQDYTIDRILGIDWEWSWYLGDVTGLIPLCPECSYQPVIRNEYTVPYREISSIECENCSFNKKLDVHPGKLEERVIKEIHRKIRTGEYEEKSSPET